MYGHFDDDAEKGMDDEYQYDDDMDQAQKSQILTGISRVGVDCRTIPHHTCFLENAIVLNTRQRILQRSLKPPQVRGNHEK